MKLSSLLTMITLGLAATTASAQVYESKDAQGTTVFSDQPSAGAEVIKVPPTNSADAMAESPRAAQPDAAAEAPRQQNTAHPSPSGQRTESDDDYIYYGGGAANNEEAQQRREEVKERIEEGAGKPGREPPAHVVPHGEARPAARPAGHAGGGRR